jgi:hypothetical protein
MPEPTVSSVGGVADRHDPLVDVVGLLDHVLLARRLALRNLHRRERMRQRMGEPPGALHVVGPAEHLVDDVHVAEQVGDDAVVRLARHVVEEHRAAAVHVLLQAGDLEIRVDRLVGLDQVAFGPQPVEHRAKIERLVGGGGVLFLAQDLLHGVPAP